jgi:hypothetical protein
MEILTPSKKGDGTDEIMPYHKTQIVAWDLNLIQF